MSKKSFYIGGFDIRCDWNQSIFQLNNLFYSLELLLSVPFSLKGI